ncbi:hypothetical protein PBCVNW6652_442R [Paramecium bursaria Chlorella virus NW665.2]|nr:hypothetical protein PBCVNW6652_442R [Paramecium bursaria Chlorella virus NW665.2]
MIAKTYTDHVKNAFKNADRMVTKISEDILKLEGMSGFKTRAFYNNISSAWGVQYLEVGSWKGSSACSAMFGNSMDITTIDNWSQFNGPQEDFQNNVNKFCGENRVTTINKDSFEVSMDELPYKYNVYLYDGDHSTEAHEKALTHYIDAMDDTFIFMIDDWMFEGVRKGTYDAIEKLNLKIEYYEERRKMLSFEDDNGPGGSRQWWVTDDDGSLRIVQSEPQEYWNGIGVFVLTKK